MLSFWSSAQVTPDEHEAVKELALRLEGTDVEDQLRRGGEGGMPPDGGLGGPSGPIARFLRAEKFDMQKAEKRLRAHAAWRTAYVLKGRISEVEIQGELDAKKVFVLGVDRKGRAVMVLRASRHSMRIRKLEETKRCICYTLDTLIRLHDLKRNPQGKCVGIFDLRGLSMDCLDIGALRAVFELLQQHYPERLAIMYMLDAPTIFWALWRAVSPFIDPETKQKVRFVSAKDAAQAFEALPGELLPPELGGSAPWIPVEEAVVKFKN